MAERGSDSSSDGEAGRDGEDAHRGSDASGGEENPESQGRAREELVRRLSDAGVDQKTLERAEAEGRLATLAVEHSLGGAAKHTLTGVAREAGIDPKFLRRILQAAGRPNPAPRERAFTDEDLELARVVRRFIEMGLPREGVLEVARVLGQGMSQTADAIRRLVGDVFLEPGDSDHTLGLRYAQAADVLTPLVGPLLEYELRALLRDGIQRNLVTEAERRAGELRGTSEVTVAFADLVGYTKLGEKLPLKDLGRIATRLAELAGSAVTQPTQLVKTIGDAAMFVSPEAPAMMATVTALLEGLEGEGEDFPALRTGIAHGPATARGGDWFGATVNLASRITDVAKPGQVLATEEVAEATGSEHEWKRRRRRGLKGIDGRVRLYSLETGE